MVEQTVENFIVALGFKTDTAALDETLVKLRELNALTKNLERLKALGVHVNVTMDVDASRAGFTVS